MGHEIHIHGGMGWVMKSNHSGVGWHGLGHEIHVGVGWGGSWTSHYHPFSRWLPLVGLFHYTV